MTSKERPDEPDTPAPAREPRSDRSPWNWLLIVPVVVPLLTFFYNSDSPRLAGFPAFYWMQILFIPLGVACTVIVYRMTRKRG